MTVPTPRNSIFDTAVIITISTAVLYLSTYFYEIGECSIYDIPGGFISINLNNVLTYSALTFFYLALFSLPCIVIVGILELATNRSILDRYRTTAFCFSIIYIIGFLELSLIFPEIKTTTLLILCGIATTMLFLIIFACVGVRFRLKSKRKINQENQGLSAELFFLKLVKKEGVFLALCVLIPYLSLLYGQFQAVKITSFIMFHDRYDFIVLKKYDDYLFCKKYDVVRNKLDDSLIVIHLPDVHKISFHSLDKDLKFRIKHL
ncbi:MAG TPA: hypothetical protein VHE59_07230 [Mucilaginibacter sp.]|nr:hypothetical protein [Mucilaginibacter sp.]